MKYKTCSNFMTLKGYKLKNKKIVTESMEDYLEMIYRYFEQEGCLHINDLANKLNVRPSSASKMVNNLNNLGYVDYQKYGVVRLTDKGKKLGSYLLYRHNIINEFLCLLNNSNDETEQAEQIEHFFNEKTIKNLENLIIRLQPK